MKKSVSVIVISSIIMVVIVFTFGYQTDGNNEISVQEVKEQIDDSSNVLLLDVRTEGEFNGSLGHLNDALLIPLAELSSRLDELEDHKDKKIIVYCRSGNRSRSGTAILRGKNFNAFNMTGGMLAWNRMMISIKQDSLKVEDEAIVH